MVTSQGETAGCVGLAERAVTEQLSDNSVIYLAERPTLREAQQNPILPTWSSVLSSEQELGTQRTF